MAPHIFRFRALGCALLACTSLTFVAASCGSDDDDSSATTTPATSPEEHIADDAVVTAGLGRMNATAASIAATVAGGTTVDDAKDQLEVDWQEVEGTFKQNEPDLYLSVEESLNGIGESAAAGDSAETARFVADLSTATTDYLAKHP